MKLFSPVPLYLIALILLVIVWLPFAASCAPGVEKTDRVGVVVTILPQAEFVENVGGDRVDVTIMVPPGADPHTYEPTPSQLVALSKARMYASVGSGVEFELAWMDKLIATNKTMLVVDCSEGVQLQEMVEENGEEHEQEGLDPHIWMSPLNAQIMVRNLCSGLTQVDPGNRAYYEPNRDAYLQKLARLDQDTRDGLSGVTNRRFMVYHPAFGYFAREYNLTMIPVEQEGKEPTAAGMAHLIEQAREHNIKIIFASPQFNAQSARVISQAIGGRVVFIDPLAKDYISNLRFLLGELVQSME